MFAPEIDDVKRPIITRAEAKALGLKRFFPDEPCKNGHVCERWMGDGKCVECKRQIIKRWENANRERLRNSKRRWRENNPESVKGSYKKGRPKILQGHREYYRRNKDAWRAYYIANAARLNVLRRQRNAAKSEERRRQPYLKRRHLLAAYAKTEKAKLARKRWKAQNRDAVRTHGRNRRAAKRLASGSHTAADIVPECLIPRTL